MSGTTIVLADDHAIVRQGLRALLEAEPDLAVVGEAGDGLEALRLVERLAPAVLVADVMMPGLNGLQVTREIQRHWPRTRVVILSMYANEAYVLEALRSGAAGYVLKEAGATDLVRAVREAAAGGRYLSPPLSERAIEAYVERARAAPPDPYDTLTTREREILQLTTEGLSSTLVAARLSISPRTVETHRANLMRKLNLRRQADLVRYAFEKGIVPVEGPRRA